MKKWNKSTEDFEEDSAIDQDETERYAEGVRRYDFDASLGAYPQEMYL